MYVKKSYKFNKSEEQYKKQSPINIKSSTENEYVNKIQKVPEQNFGAYEDLYCYNRLHFGPF